jgi:hypothetical protein
MFTWLQGRLALAQQCLHPGVRWQGPASSPPIGEAGTEIVSASVEQCPSPKGQLGEVRWALRLYW